MPRGVRAGHDRERAYAARLREQGWFVLRSRASKGVADLVALKPGEAPRFFEVKSSAAGPFAHFGPRDRADFIREAELAGAVPVLVHWPPRSEPVEIPVSEWPGSRKEAA